MNITVTLRHGPLDVEIEAENGEDYRQEILDLSEFLEDNDEALEAFNRAVPQPVAEEGTTTQASLQESANPSSNGSNSGGDDDTDVDDGGPLAPIASATGIGESTLEHLIAAPQEDDRVPYLVLDDLEILGSKEVDKKRSAALILLLAFHECYDADRIPSSDLKDAFIRSGVPEDHINEAYHDEGKRFFDPKGRGGSASVALLGPGKREAKKEINRIISEMNI